MKRDFSDWSPRGGRLIELLLNLTHGEICLGQKAAALHKYGLINTYNYNTVQHNTIQARHKCNRHNTDIQYVSIYVTHLHLTPI